MATPPKPTGHQPAIAPPALLLKWQTWAIGMALMLIPFFVPIPIVLRQNPIISPLGDELHIPLLAGITLFLYWRGPLSGRLWQTAVAAAAIGGAIEFIQIPFGRQAAFMDFVTDLVGIGLVAGWVIWRGHGQRRGLGLILVLLMFLPARLYRVPFVASAAFRAQDIFPVIADLEGPRDHWLWNGNGAVASLVASEDTPSGSGHLLRLEAGPPTHWPSAEMRRFPHDWSNYSALLLDVRLVEGAGDTQRFSVRCDDFTGRREHNWIYTPATATRSWQTFRIPLANRPVTDGVNVGDRLFDRRDVDRVLIYLSRPQSAAVLEIDNLRLE